MNHLFDPVDTWRSASRRWLLWAAGVLGAMLLLLGPSSAQAQSGQSVYALPGTLRTVEGKPYETVLATFDGNRYGLLGQTPAVELEIIRLRNLGPAEVVKVWGTLYPAGLTSQDPEIVVESILSDSAPPPPAPPASTPVTATPTPVAATPTPSAPQATIASTTINVRSGPGTDYTIVNTLTPGTTCAIIGRNAATTWWNIRCASGVTGWVYAPLVVTAGSTNGVPVVTVAPPAPTPTPTTPPAPPVGTSVWRASYYNNRDLSGNPVVTTQAGEVNFNWGNGAPADGVPADNFSARFERVLSFATGSYLLELTVDDGVRLYIDNAIVLDNWQVSSARTLTVQRTLSGNHTFRIDYFEAGGQARIQFSIREISTAQDWRVSYFNNPQLAGGPVLVRGEARGSAPIDNNWGTGSPVAGTVPNDRWSARFEGTFYFESGDYQFQANVDDGIRLYIDGIRVLDVWQPGYRSTSNIFRRLGAGNHQVTVEYFEDIGSAYLRVWWDRINDSGSSGGGGGGRDE